MKIFKKLFCKHDYLEIKNNYALLGWWRCNKCGKEKYDAKNLESTYFKFPKITITKK